jgi:dCTP deaminase
MSGTIVRQEIIRRVKEQKLVENHDIKECVSPASYELRVGSYYDWQTNTRVDLQRGEAIAVAPNGFLLVGTVERVTLPFDIMGMMYLRSTYARRGFVSWFQGIVDPGYSGALTVVLHNLTGDLVPIYGEERICHLVFEQLPEPVDKGYEGAYQGSHGASPPRQAPSVKIVGDRLTEIGKAAAESIPRALIAELLKNPDSIRRLFGG